MRDLDDCSWADRQAECSFAPLPVAPKVLTSAGKFHNSDLPRTANSGDYRGNPSHLIGTAQALESFKPFSSFLSQKTT
jgi:hypothetical protein